MLMKEYYLMLHKYKVVWQALKIYHELLLMHFSFEDCIMI